MAYYGIVTTLENVRKAPNSDNLYIGECLREDVIVGPNMKEGDLVLYLPSDGAIEHWFGDKFKLFRKFEDGTPQGGYLEDKGNIRAVKLRGNKSSGIVILCSAIVMEFGDQGWVLGDKVHKINGETFCYKHIPLQKSPNNTPKTSIKGKKSNKNIVYPDFEKHKDTEQLMYNLHCFKVGDKINMTLKMHGTSQRSAYTWAVYPQSKLRKFFHIPSKRKMEYVLGTRRTVVDTSKGGFYGDDGFRFSHHEALKPYLEDGMEVYYEVVGYYGAKENETIMPICDNAKLNDKDFVKKYGKQTVFNYGCTPGHSSMWIYRITSRFGEYEYSPAEITSWCLEHGFNRVPVVEDFVFTSVDDMLTRINKYFEDLTDPIGQTHVKEGVVLRIVNRPSFTAFKTKTYAFKMLSGLPINNTDISHYTEDMLSEM